jgi:hypothetical protein
MAASTTGALKAFLEAQGLGISVYRDQAPAGTARPYLTVNEAVAVTMDPLEDGAASTVVEEATVDIWMDWKNPATGALSESYTLPGAVIRAIHGARLASIGTSPSQVVYGILVRRAGPRIVEMEENSGSGIVHYVLQLDIFRAA